MNDILSKLFHGDYYPTPFLTKKQQELTKQLMSYQDGVARWLGLDFLDEMEELQGEIHEIAQEKAFSDGFRLGARLMLEALTPPSEPS